MFTVVQVARQSPTVGFGCIRKAPYSAHSRDVCSRELSETPGFSAAGVPCDGCPNDEDLSTHSSMKASIYLDTP